MHPGIWTRVSRRATNNNNNQNTGKKTTDDRRNSLYRLTHSIICRFYSSKIFVTNAQNDDLFHFSDDTLYVSSSWSLKKIPNRIIWNFSHHFVELHRRMNCIRWKFDGSICTRIQNKSDADSWFSNELSWVMHTKRISFHEHLHLSQPIYGLRL